MKISLFFRKKTNYAYSIERVFEFVSDFIAKKSELKKVYLPYETKSLFKLLGNMIFVFKTKSEINHITGDVHYIAAVLSKKNTVLTIHDCGSILNHSMTFKQHIKKWIWFTMPVRRAAKIVAISEKTKKEIMLLTNCDENKISIIPDSISYDFKKSDKVFNSKNPTILHVGTQVNKNLENVIKAVENIDCELRIIGKLSESQKQLLEKSHIDYVNRFSVSDEDIVKEYANCDIVTFPSYYEGFGMPILEAQASGKPVVTANLSPMKEVAGDGALLVRPDNINEINDAIEKIIKDDLYRNQIVNLGLENVKKYRPDVVAEEYIKLYKEVLGKNG